MGVGRRRNLEPARVGTFCQSGWKVHGWLHNPDALQSSWCFVTLRQAGSKSCSHFGPSHNSFLPHSFFFFSKFLWMHLLLYDLLHFFAQCSKYGLTAIVMQHKIKQPRHRFEFTGVIMSLLRILARDWETARQRGQGKENLLVVGRLVLISYSTRDKHKAGKSIGSSLEV
jgi:hypothetical protein